jgi:AcrR family transcriptional regulator
MPETPKLGRPPVLSREAIVDAALAEGLDTLTMGAVAARLGVVKSALYRWVRGREELLGLVSDVVVERVLPGDGGPEDWREWLADLARRMRREFLAVPGYAARIAGPHEHHSDAHEVLVRTVEARLRAAGFAGAAAGDTCRLVLTAVVGWVAAEAHWSPDLQGERFFEIFVAALLRGLGSGA